MNVIDIWTSTPNTSQITYVIPDGCQDVILVQREGQKPISYLSPLFEQTIQVQIEPNTKMTGFRLHPGCKTSNLIPSALVSSAEGSLENLQDEIESKTYVEPRLKEALSCLKENGKSLSYCAKQLGVSPRTLQRLMTKHTCKSPTYWARLARVRQCAIALMSKGLTPDLAYEFSFSDQAHMCREFKHWFGVSPLQFSRRPDLNEQLFWDAY